jgi:uncharacterized protein (DUF1697 family)
LDVARARARSFGRRRCDTLRRSKLNLKPLGSGTARNWNTMLKLQEILLSVGRRPGV